jgi:hypothetical protein
VYDIYEDKETRYGTITYAMQDFGYGSVWIDDDGSIAYQDACGYKKWKTIKGFEKWVAKQNAMCGGVYENIND